MRIPLSWLNEYVDLEPGATADGVLASLVSVGFEEEDIHRFEIAGPVVVGRVVDFDVEIHPNGKTMRWCQVDVGESHGGQLGIVCGADNFAAGEKLVVALPGAVLPGSISVAPRTAYGHLSNGVLLSSKELGLGDDHTGVLRLAAWGLDPEIGSDAVRMLGLDDEAIEINVTPDRGYALSIRGVAREYSHATGASFRDPASLVDRISADGLNLEVTDEAPIRGREGTEAYCARIIRGVAADSPSPPWMVARLALAGIRSVSIVVDVTNYVMVEMGVPIHAYDLDRVTGAIRVRRAVPGETLQTLDGQMRDLHPEDLLVADEAGPLGLAGVMGGAETEISRSTSNVLVEAASFDPVSVARSSRRHKAPSEASRRFERGVDPSIAPVAVARVVGMIKGLAGGEVDSLGGDYIAVRTPKPIALPERYVADLIGVDYTAEKVVSALQVVGCRLATVSEGWNVTPPSWRTDLIDKCSLAEEVARIEGYESIPSILPTAPPGRGLSLAQEGRERVANALAASGFVETPSFPFTTAEANNLYGSSSGDALPSVRLANALDGTAPYLRRTLLPGLLHIAHRNVSRGFTDLALFETGTVFLPEVGVKYGTVSVPRPSARPSDATLAALDASIPPQVRHVGVLLVGAVFPQQAGLDAVAAGVSDGLDAARVIASAAGVRIQIRQAERAALHPGRTGSLMVGTTEVGYLGELLPEVAASVALPGRVIVAELNLDLLLALSEQGTATPLSTFPAATQDVSLVVPASTPAAGVSDAFQRGAGDLLESMRLVDDYREQGIPEGSKSLTYALRFRANDRTLTAAEANEAKLAGLDAAASRFGATLRS